MFGKGVRLFRLFGFEVRIDASWLLLAVLVILSLTSGYFPLYYGGLSRQAHLVMGIIGAFGLFASIVLHEACHSLVGRHYGVTMKGISLFVFGGVAEMENEAKTPGAEFAMAVAGPLASFVLAGLFYVSFAGAVFADLPLALIGVLRYLSWINVVLALFNLLPAFPLDGGRMLRAGLWAWRRNLRWATRIASGIGAAFGIVLILLGILNLLAGSIVGGLWWCLIGMFLRGISHGSYRQVVVREVLAGEPVRRFVRRRPVAVPAGATVHELVTDYIYQHHFKMFPVVDQGKLTGCVSTREVKTVPREEWERRHVADIATGCSEANTIGPDADATDALAAMHRTGNSRLMVVENGSLMGIISLKDMLQFLALKLDLEGDGRDENKREAA